MFVIFSLIGTAATGCDVKNVLKKHDDVRHGGDEVEKGLNYVYL